MPDDDPGTCVGEDAEKVAAYIHDAFYSKTAQARNKPARIELSRLTVRQYQNTLADLIGSFRGPRSGTAARAARRVLQIAAVPEEGRPDRSIASTRRSSSISASTCPTTAKTIGHKFAIRWEGSVLAPETGDYEFIVRTEHSARLWVNDLKKPLIDRWVKSGNDTEFREIDPPAGRPRLSDPARVLQGQAGREGRQEEDPDPPPTKATIALLWKAPQQADEVIPQRNLSPSKAPEIVRAPDAVPARRPQRRLRAGHVDLEGLGPGHDRRGARGGATTWRPTSASWRESRTTPRTARPSSASSAASSPSGRSAGRSPTSRRRSIVDRQFKAAKDADAARQAGRPAGLKSPRFLYHEIERGLDAYDVACRISFGLWDSLPDQALLDAAAAGKLATREQVAEQAERMVGDLRTRSKVREFLLQWLRVDRAADVSKDPKLFPQFTPGDRLGPADLAGPVPGRRGLERMRPTSAGCSWPTTCT